MIKVKVFKTRIYISPAIEHQFNMGFGTRRRCWNRGVDQYFNQDNKISNFKMDMLLNSLIKDDEEQFGWIKLVNTMIKTNALKDLGLSLKKFNQQVRKNANSLNNENPNKGKPKFKKKKDSTQSFRLSKKDESTFKILGHNTFNFNWTREYGRISVRTRESLDFLNVEIIKEITILRQAGKLYISICYEKKVTRLRKKGIGKIGLDLGVKHLYSSYDGLEFTVFDKCNLDDANHHIALINQKLALKVYNSNNYNKLLLNLQKRYKKGADIKRDSCYKEAVRLCEKYDTIVIDDFSYKAYLAMNQVKGIVGRHDRIRKLNEVSPCLFKEILEYVASKYGVEIIYVTKGTPTTQTCSKCGHKQEKKLELKDRIFKCEHCGFTIDRDFNSAINTFNYS